MLIYSLHPDSTISRGNADKRLMFALKSFEAYLNVKGT